MTDGERKYLLDKFSNRDLITELEYGINHPAGFGAFMPKEFTEFYRWLCLAALEKINVTNNKVSQ
jgi:hypothetical protein